MLPALFPGTHHCCEGAEQPETSSSPRFCSLLKAAASSLVDDLQVHVHVMHVMLAKSERNYDHVRDVHAWTRGMCHHVMAAYDPTPMIGMW